MRVLKFGGKSLSSTKKINRLAKKIATFKEKKVIVVVSAMGETTSELLSLSQEVSPKKKTSQSIREMDMLLASGERVSASLFSLALQKCGRPSVSFTGSQAGILTEGPHNDASIKKITPYRVDEALQKGLIPVIAGFQGVDPITKDITTLGRGGSDLTACALAHYYKCKAELYKSVGAVYSCDPNLESGAKKIPELNYDFLKALSFWGGKVLHDKAALFVQEHKVPLSFMSDNTFEEQSLVTDSSNKSFVISVLNPIVALKVEGLKIPEALSALKSFFNKDSFKILASAFNSNDSRFLISISEDQLNIFTKQNKFEVLDAQVSAVSLIFSHPQKSEILSNIVAALKDFEIKRLLESEKRLTFFVSPQIKMELVKKLHSLISL